LILSGKRRWLPTVATDLLAGVCRDAQMQMFRQPWHAGRDPLPNRPRQGHFSRVAAVQLFRILIVEAGDGHAF